MALARDRWLLAVLLIVPFALALSTPVAATPLADSAILLIGDGMGPTQIAVAREARGGEPLAMETTPVSGLMTTHSADAAVTDSAAAGTALATGHKTNNGMISVTPDGRRLVTILERCRAMYKATGIITTDALHGATPAVFAAHAESRGMRSEIALQLAESRVPVMMGFWKGWFLPKSAGGERDDGRDLIARLRGDGYAVAFTREQLFEASGPRLLGLFDDGAHAPTLAEMVGAALPRLSDNPGGFFLMVEGARIDWKCHGNDPAGAVLDTWEFDEAVAAALAFARTRGRTLVVVTADHETGGITIDDRRRVHRLGSVRASCEAMAGKLNSGRTNVAEVLSEGAQITDLTASELSSVAKAEDPAAAIAGLVSSRSGVSWTTGGHTDTPVRVLAFGPGADRFAGEMDNTDIPKRIAEVLGIGAFPE